MTYGALGASVESHETKDQNKATQSDKRDGMARYVSALFVTKSVNSGAQDVCTWQIECEFVVIRGVKEQTQKSKWKEIPYQPVHEFHQIDELPHFQQNLLIQNLLIQNQEIV